MILNVGGDLTGVNLAVPPATMNYEVEFQAMRVEGEDFFVYVRRCSQNPVGCIVKLADMQDNSDPIRKFQGDAERLVRYSKARQIVEQAMVARTPDRHGMDRAHLERFIQHYERTSRHLLATLPARADRVVVLDEARRPMSR